MDEVDNSPSSALEQKRGWVIAQLGGACNLADISEASTQDVLQFLIIHAFFEVDAAMVQSPIQAFIWKPASNPHSRCQHDILSKSSSLNKLWQGSAICCNSQWIIMQT